MTLLRRLILGLLPRRFRDRHGRDLLELYRDMYPASGMFRRVRFCVRVLVDALITCITVHSNEVLRRSTKGVAYAAGKYPVEEEKSLISRGILVILSIGQDVRYAIRTLRRRLLFSTITVLTLGLGIGATTAMFSVVEGVLLRPLPYERPGELVHIWGTYPRWRDNPQRAGTWDRTQLTYPDYQRLRENQTTYVDVGIYSSSRMTLTSDGRPERVYAGVASYSLFPVLGIRPALGRFFHQEEEGTYAARVTVLSFQFWVERFGSDPDVLGQTITLDGMPFTVVGVLPPSFYLRYVRWQSTEQRPFWIPVGADGESLGPGEHMFDGIARLKPGVTVTQATGETDALIRGDRELSAKGARLQPRTAAEAAGLTAPLVMLMAASMVLMLIACGNVSLLFLGEVHARHPEIATRVALGAGKSRIVRQFLAESLLLGVVASVLGAFLAICGTQLLLTTAPPIPRLDEVGVNGIVLLFAAVVGLGTGAFFGVVPCLGLSQTEIHGVLQRVRQSGSRRESISQHLVVSLEIALTVVLLVSGGLLVRSLMSLQGLDRGFREESIVEVRVELPSHADSRYRYRATQLSTHQEIRAALESVPGVTAVSAATQIPVSDYPPSQGFHREEAGIEIGESQSVYVTSVLPGYIETMGIPLIAGRTISSNDRENTPKVAVINESMARQCWPGESPLGTRFILLGGPDTVTVIGVVGDVRYGSLSNEIRPSVFISAMEWPRARMSFVVKSELAPEILFPQLRDVVWSTASDALIPRTTTVSSLALESTRNERFRTVLLTIFGVCAALLAASGVFGVTARGVTRRYREFGIRVALGAREKRLVNSTIRENVIIGLVGTAVGLVGAFGVSRLLTGFLFGVAPFDPFTYGTVGLLALIVSGLASYVPARRIKAVDPVEVLRAE